MINDIAEVVSRPTRPFSLRHYVEGSLHSEKFGAAAKAPTTHQLARGRERLMFSGFWDGGSRMKGFESEVEVLGLKERTVSDVVVRAGRWKIESDEKRRQLPPPWRCLRRTGFLQLSLAVYHLILVLSAP